MESRAPTPLGYQALACCRTPPVSQGWRPLFPGLEDGHLAIPNQVREAIAAEYVAFGVPADDIATDTQLATQFATRVNARLPKEEHLSVDACKATTLKLRKRGEANGGLPRLQNGHGPSKGGPKNGHNPNKL